LTHWTYTEADGELVDRLIDPFLPDHIFDAHAHLFRLDHYAPGELPDHLRQAPPQLGLEAYHHYIEWLHPHGRTRGGLFFGLAFTGRREENNAFVAAEVAADPYAFGQMIVAPDMDPEYIRQEVKRRKFVGLKCYHTMAKVEGPTWQAPIEVYLPEEHVRIAHEEGLSITLHMVRERALADPVNQATIRRYCQRYPNIRLILAHAARGFNPWHTIEGIHSLQGLANVWFDTAAVTEAGAFEAIVEVMGYERLLYGTDFHVSHLRGRCVAIGDSFHWIYADELALEERHTQLRPVLIGIESLRSLILACHRLKLSDSQIEALFFGNAQQLWGLGSPR
jgi:glutamate-1-semialdehyde 2,1-aminomutase